MLKGLIEKKIQPKILHLEKLVFKSGREIKTFLSKQKAERAHY